MRNFVPSTSPLILPPMKTDKKAVTAKQPKRVQVSSASHVERGAKIAAATKQAVTAYNAERKRGTYLRGKIVHAGPGVVLSANNIVLPCGKAVGLEAKDESGKVVARGIKLLPAELLNEEQAKRLAWFLHVRKNRDNKGNITYNEPQALKALLESLGGFTFLLSGEAILHVATIGSEKLPHGLDWQTGANYVTTPELRAARKAVKEAQAIADKALA